MAQAEACKQQHSSDEGCHIMQAGRGEPTEVMIQRQVGSGLMGNLRLLLCGWSAGGSDPESKKHDAEIKVLMYDWKGKGQGGNGAVRHLSEFSFLVGWKASASTFPLFSVCRHPSLLLLSGGRKRGTRAIQSGTNNRPQR